MQIAYFAHVNGGSSSGVIHKIAGQAQQWRSRGHIVRVFVLTRDDARQWQCVLSDAVVYRYDRVLSRLKAMTRLVHEMRRFQPKVVYMRWDLFYPQMLCLPAQAVLVVEVNTDDLYEYALGGRIRAFYNARTRDIMLGRARGLVFVTSELSLRPSFLNYPGRHCVVTNGIRLDAYPTFPAPANEHPRLVFIGTAGQPWHGVDKLVTLAALRRDWRFDIVGMRNETNTSSPNIAWHGPLERARALGILAHADVGVGSLAMHRNALNEACSLKVREYLAVGLPVIYANQDSDADELDRYALRIANTESNVVDELPRIEAFVERSRGLRVPRSSVSHIDVAEKERQRLALFEDLAGT
jgi:Glycosyl transferases group 1